MWDRKKANISVLQTQHVLFVRCWDVSDFRYLILKIKNADTSFSLAKEIFSHGKSRIFGIHHARICCASSSSRRERKNKFMIRRFNRKRLIHFFSLLKTNFQLKYCLVFEKKISQSVSQSGKMLIQVWYFIQRNNKWFTK